MNRLVCLLLIALVSLVAAGCGDGGEKGKYKGRDKPVPPPAGTTPAGK